MIAQLNGSKIRSEAEFHGEIAAALNLGPYYGRNLDALWDVLTRNVERPVSLVWNDAETSRTNMPAAFETIVGLLRDVERQDAEYGRTDRFELTMR